MARASQGYTVRYPLHALLAVAGAGVLFLFDMIVGFVFMALIPPLIPVYACVLFGGTCLLGNALKYAERVSIRLPAAMLPPGKHEDQARDRSATSRAA